MKPRIDVTRVSPKVLQAMLALQNTVNNSGLERPLLELVKMRASQINGCAYCLDMHTQEARAAGEAEQRLYALTAWRETPFFTDRERAALAWTEAVTQVSGGVSDELYEEARRHFGEQELVTLTWAVITINSWNRLAISFRAVPGTYKPEMRKQVEALLAGAAN